MITKSNAKQEPQTYKPSVTSTSRRNIVNYKVFLFNFVRLLKSNRGLNFGSKTKWDLKKSTFNLNNCSF
ncbi:hypothetical protein Hanom_Chr14g01294311 [Helianthus anomalus]